MSITTKIWLSVGVFILGYVISTTLSQIQNHATRSAMKMSSEGLFPAAQKSQEAEEAFQRTVKGFGDAVILQDATAIERAAVDGMRAVNSLQTVAAIPGLLPERSASAGKLASSIRQILGDARTTYGSVLSGSITAESQDKMRGLATRTDAARAGLEKLKEATAGDLHQQLSDLEEWSARQSSIALAVFFVTLLLAGVIVHLTIQRSITGPVIRVIGGVQEAAGDAALAAAQVAQSGVEVTNSAHEQATCVEETSTSLTKISASTRRNADLAADADQLMQTAHDMVERASTSMNELRASMTKISTSSQQVAAVLQTIDQIAFQTNILALNAAVEAARAGTAGAGFTVVADEVRLLAQRSAEAVRNSGVIIEQTVTDVSNGVVLVGRAHKAFQEVSGAISDGTGLVSKIATSSEEQARGIELIGRSISRIESITQRNVTNAQQTARGASAMSSMVENTRSYLDELVSLVGMAKSGSRIQ